MRLFGFNITRSKAAAPPPTATAVDTRARWMDLARRDIHEPFTGAWQRNISAESCENVLKFSAVYACVDLIASDISKLRIRLVQRQGNDIWTETTSPAFSPVLRKPNRYQTRIQFMSQWITSKLLYGNAYILKERDQRNVVVALYVLDPSRVTPLVTSEGDVWYELKGDDLAQVPRGERVVIPASELIHDRMLTLWHPLIGVSPIYACGASATQGIRIQNNSEQFFGNMSRPSGVLTYPEALADKEARDFKEDWQRNNAGLNAGKVAVLSGGATYAPFTIPAQDAQLIEQLRWTVEDIARAFHVPLHKLGASQPTFNNISSLNLDYYQQALQALIESVELLLDEGLATPPEMGTELDLEGLLRMDPIGLADVNEKAIRAGYLAPNEARQRSNLGPVEGGETPYMQQQNWALSALAERPPPDTVKVVAPVAEPEEAKPEPDEDKSLASAIAFLTQRLKAAHVGA